MSVTSNEGAEAFITEPGAFVGLVQDAVEQETGLVPKLSTSGGTSDARFIKNYCRFWNLAPPTRPPTRLTSIYRLKSCAPRK